MQINIRGDDNALPFINEVWAAFCIEGGKEHLCIMRCAHDCTPLMVVREAEVEWLHARAQDLYDQTGMRIRLVKFSTREVVAEYPPPN